MVGSDRVLRLRWGALAVGLWLLPLAAAAQEDGAPSSPPPAGGEVVDGIAAQVGTDVVLVSDVTRLSGPIEAQMREAGATDADVGRMREEVLDRLIDRTLISLFAKRNEIQPSDAEIDEAVQAVATENQMSLEQLRQSVESQGMGWDAYRKRLGDEIVQQKVIGGMVRARIRVEEAEIRSYYEERFGDQPTTGDEVHLQHIAVAARDEKPASKRAACDRVRSALGQVRSGRDFLDVAREFSEGTPDLGFVPIANLAPWMADPVNQLAPGTISNVIELPVGCAVLRLVERREVQPVSFEQAADRIQRVLMDQKYEQELETFLERLRKQTYVERKNAFDSARTDASSGAGTRLQ
jgi:peptidyl-prolyl cis-trans isomerase SurA